MARMTATEAARNFSDVLSRAASGEEIELTRSGAPVALIGPPKGLVSAARFRELIAGAPRPDDEFAGPARGDPRLTPRFRRDPLHHAQRDLGRPRP